jgi:tetratricopeptide (TPR) repeat protein
MKVAGKGRDEQEAAEQRLDSPASAGQEAGSPAPAAAVPQSVETAPAATPSTVKEAAQPPYSPVAPVAPAPPPGRVRASVFVYNLEQGRGYARLPDNRVVLLDDKCLNPLSMKPFPGYDVEFELQLSGKDLVANAIQVLPPDGQRPELEVVKPTVEAPARKRPDPPPVVRSPSPRTSGTWVSSGGTSESRRLYREAVVARTEGRVEEARKLFQRAIEAGGETQVYEVFFAMEVEERHPAEALRIIQLAISQFPHNANFYDMYGHMERRVRNYQSAQRIFREGLFRCPNSALLKIGLWRTLVQIGIEDGWTTDSSREAGELFESLDQENKLNRSDVLYQKFSALQRHSRVSRAFNFFQTAGMRVGIVARQPGPQITDVVAETNVHDLSESFGLSGAILVRCFHRTTSQIDIVNLIEYLRGLGTRGVLGLLDRKVVVNPSLAFIAVPDSNAVRDQVMSILGESNEAIIPLDDAVFRSSDPLKTLRDLLGQYLGRRDLYSGTLPVSGRRFFGRERLLLQLTDEVHHGQFLGVYGLRKMGKTSLIYQLRDEKLRGEAVAYVDLQRSAALTVKDCAPLYWELENDLYIRLREHSPEAADMLRLGQVERFSDLPDGGARAGLLFAEDLRAFLDALSAGGLPGIERLVIVLDELEWILPAAGQSGVSGYVEFFGLLRGLAQTERYRGLLSSIVVAANAAISERGYWEGRENPVFALYKPVFLPPLSGGECEEMIRTLGKGMSVYWEDGAIAAVLAETGGHPFLTRVLCSRIAKQYPARPLTVTVDRVRDQVPYFIRDESDKLEQITELLRTHFPGEETLLEQIALDESPADLTDESLRHLMGYGLIAADGAGYRVTLNLLRRWLRRRAGMR